MDMGAISTCIFFSDLQILDYYTGRRVIKCDEIQNVLVELQIPNSYGSSP
jgi:hypothetical protein